MPVERIDLLSPKISKYERIHAWTGSPMITGLTLTRTAIDEPAAVIPPFFIRMSGTEILNTVGSAKLGIFDATPYPPGGHYDRDSDGPPQDLAKTTSVLTLVDGKVAYCSPSVSTGISPADRQEFNPQYPTGNQMRLTSRSYIQIA